MFVQSAGFVERHQGRVNQLSIYGQELKANTWKLAQMNLAIHGLEGDLGKGAADTFFEDQHQSMRADYILANPPFNMKEWGGDKLVEDVRWKYGLPPAGNANYGWMQHMIYHLAPKGKLGLVLAYEDELRLVVYENKFIVSNWQKKEDITTPSKA